LFTVAVRAVAVRAVVVLAVVLASGILASGILASGILASGILASGRVSPESHTDFIIQILSYIFYHTNTHLKKIYKKIKKV
jgi:hypothetical protein